MPTVGFFFTLFADYGAERGGELPGKWFVRALEPFGVEESTVRQTLYRMVREGMLASRRAGRNKIYRLTDLGQAATDPGRSRLQMKPENTWDGYWMLVTYQFATEDRVARTRLKDALFLEGFGQLTRGVHVHPRDKTEWLQRALGRDDLLSRVNVFRGRRIGGQSDHDLVRSTWDLDSIRGGYERFISRFSPLARREWSHHDPSIAVQLRLASVRSFLETAWQDPGFPLELLPQSWPALRAQEIAETLYKKLKPPLMKYGDSLMSELNVAGLPRSAKTSHKMAPC